MACAWAGIDDKPWSRLQTRPSFLSGPTAIGATVGHQPAPVEYHAFDILLSSFVVLVHVPFYAL